MRRMQLGPGNCCLSPPPRPHPTTAPGDAVSCTFPLPLPAAPCSFCLTLQSIPPPQPPTHAPHRLPKARSAEMNLPPPPRRFQKARSAEMNLLLREFALAQAGLAADGAKAWGALLAELQAINGGPAA